MNHLERTKGKINALLSKTTENGASEAEMLSAIKLAEKLMRKYSILKSDLPEVEQTEKCILRSEPNFKSGYRMSYFYRELADLFDCEYYRTKTQVTFFGYEGDVQLCFYFTDLIQTVCLKEKDKFMKTNEAKELKKHLNGRTIASNFVKGFILRICERLAEMYAEKKAESNSKERGIILVKKNNVDEQFSQLGIRIKTVNSSISISNRKSYNAGAEKANKVPLTQGVGADARRSAQLA